MPPRRSGRVAAAAEQRVFAFPQLPLPLVVDIFLLLPADQRLRAAEVSRGWRVTVSLPALWRRLDLSPASGVAQRALAALLRAAAARAGPALHELDVSHTHVDAGDLRDALLVAGAVEEVRAPSRELNVDDVTALLGAAPRLRALHAGVHTRLLRDAVGLLEGRAPFAPLRLRTLDLDADRDGALPTSLTLALANDHLQPGLVHLTLTRVDFRAQGRLDAVVDAVVARQRLSQLTFDRCALSRLAVPALARALRDGALTALAFCFGTLPLLDDDHDRAVLCGSLHASGTLTSLTLHWVPRLAAPVVAALLGALVGHRSLQVLSFCGTRLEGAHAAGAALGALLNADAPALRELDVSSCGLGEAGLGALLDALPSNRHLLTLDIRGNDAPAGFMRARLLPFVRANTSLRTLLVIGRLERDENTAAWEAQRIVAARGGMHAAAPPPGSASHA